MCENNHFNYENLPEWQIDIIIKYPKIYLDPNPSLKEWFKNGDYDELINHPYFCNLRFGFECGEGWNSLINEFSQTSNEILMQIEMSGFDMKNYYIKSLIFKEKMGGLCFQGNYKLPVVFDKLFRSYVNEINRRSFNICEMTGSYGQLVFNSRGLRKVLSPAKQKELGYFNKNIVDILV